MERIIKTIEEKLKAQEDEIRFLRLEKEELKRKIKERDEAIAELEKRGAVNETV